MTKSFAGDPITLPESGEAMRGELIMDENDSAPGVVEQGEPTLVTSR